MTETSQTQNKITKSSMKQGLIACELIDTFPCYKPSINQKYVFQQSMVYVFPVKIIIHPGNCLRFIVLQNFSLLSRQN